MWKFVMRTTRLAGGVQAEYSRLWWFFFLFLSVCGKFSSGSLNLEPAVSAFCSNFAAEILLKAASLLSQLLMDVQRRIFFLQHRTASTTIGMCLRRSARRSVQRFLWECRSFNHLLFHCAIQRQIKLLCLVCDLIRNLM